jgi:hypothetical protein
MSLEMQELFVQQSFGSQRSCVIEPCVSHCMWPHAAAHDTQHGSAEICCGVHGLDGGTLVASCDTSVT